MAPWNPLEGESTVNSFSKLPSESVALYDISDWERRCVQSGPKCFNKCFNKCCYNSQISQNISKSVIFQDIISVLAKMGTLWTLMPNSVKQMEKNIGSFSPTKNPFGEFIRYYKAWPKKGRTDGRTDQPMDVTTDFFDASTHLYKRVCPSVGRSVGRSVVGPWSCVFF